MGRPATRAVSARERTIGWVCCLAVLVAAGVGIWRWTLGLRAFTSYSYALETAGPLPRVAPHLWLVDQFGREAPLESLRGRYVLLHAFYGSCQTVCPIVLVQLREIYAALPPAKRARLELVSMTIDPERDTAAMRLGLWREMGAVPSWIVARPSRATASGAAARIGVWVFRRKDGSINHSAYLFLIDPQGRIVDVISPQLDVEQTRRDLEAHL